MRQLINFEFRRKTVFFSIFNLKFPSIDISKELNWVKADKEINSKLGKLKSITKADINTLKIGTEN